MTRQLFDPADLAMQRLAIDRSKVLFSLPTGREVTVRLVCWRGRAGAHRCRVELRDGHHITVDTAMVRPLPERKL